MKPCKRWPWIERKVNPQAHRKFYVCRRCGKYGVYLATLSLNNNWIYPGDREFVKQHSKCKEAE